MKNLSDSHVEVTLPCQAVIWYMFSLSKMTFAKNPMPIALLRVGKKNNKPNIFSLSLKQQARSWFIYNSGDHVKKMLRRSVKEY